MIQRAARTGRDIQQILADGNVLLKEHVKAEMHQSTVEFGTEIRTDARLARRQVVQLRSELAPRRSQWRGIASAGTHPLSNWAEQPITHDERYATIVNGMQQIARTKLIFGLHVHVAIPDREGGIDIMTRRGISCRTCMRSQPIRLFRLVRTQD